MLVAAVMSLRGSCSTHTKCLSQLRRRKKRTQDDKFSEILQASAVSDREQGAWRVNIADCMEKERADMRNSQQKVEEEMH
ncbi:unnamed protein product [Caretta caretta]